MPEYHYKEAFVTAGLNNVLQIPTQNLSIWTYLANVIRLSPYWMSGP